MVQIVISSAGAGGLAEWVLMELQGEIEARHSTGLAGNLLGDLHYTTEVRGLFFPCLMPQESKLHQGGAPRTHSEDCPQVCYSGSSQAPLVLPSTPDHCSSRVIELWGIWKGHGSEHRTSLTWGRKE
ncbi:hypothetical protein FD755_005429 [Muntiacus reevesi]|uniref:Chromosome transmission fidelity protein 8 homolog n=1 Tax=Muntiacus reevesi TaxID=9886 RepID=A0A5J5MVK3_MUNRE|nr:hypothetical protein FD755_005429 [Muntiacus reevesi]